MSKLKNKTCSKVIHDKREKFPRKAKDQSLVNLEHLAVMMEIIAGSDDEKIEIDLKKRRSQPKKRYEKQNKSLKTEKITSQDNDSSCRSNKMNDNLNCKNRSQKKQIKTPKSPVLVSNTGGLSHFMELGARTDLLSDSQMADPLGPDGFDNFQWVEVKQELPDDIEVCKVTLTELPLKINDGKSTVGVNGTNDTKSDKGTDGDVVSKLELSSKVPCHEVEEEPSPRVLEKSVDANQDEYENLGSFFVGDKSSDGNSSADESFIEKNETENIEKVSIQKKKNSCPQQCDICDKKLHSKGSLRLHKMKMHRVAVQFPCELCSLKFDLQRMLVQHRNTQHRGEDGRFGCEACGKRILDYHSYLVHVKSHVDRCVEEEGSDKLCSDCDKSFRDDESLRIHRTLVHTVDLRGRLKSQDKNFICDTCGRRFAFGCQLRDHINTHTGAKPYLCQQCGKAFCQKSTLKQHTKTHSEVRPFQCPDCPQGFYASGDYIKHRRKHTGERPYVCEVCGEGFSRSTHLVVHRRTHTGERPHVCDICDRGFTKRGDVIRHRRVHTGELPYLCQVCGKAFRQSTQCSNHIKSHHPDSSASVARNPNPLIHAVHLQLLC